MRNLANDTRVRTLAYLLWEKRGGSHYTDDDFTSDRDWLDAERLLKASTVRVRREVPKIGTSEAPGG
jgi:hypothetical protein